MVSEGKDKVAEVESKIPELQEKVREIEVLIDEQYEARRQARRDFRTA